MTRYVYVGSGTSVSDGSDGQGIFVYRMDALTGNLEKLHSIVSGWNPSFLCMDQARNFLYCVNESNDGAASAFAVDRYSGSLELINRVKTKGDLPCYITIDPLSRRALVANYGSGCLSVFPVEPDGRLGEISQKIRHEGCATDPSRRLVAVDDKTGPIAIVSLRGEGSVPEGVVPDRQETAHAHSVIFDPSGNYVLSADLGMDRIWVYRYQDGEIKSIHEGLPGANVAWYEVEWYGEQTTIPRRTGGGHNLIPGSGPRHLAFHPNRMFVYASNELNSSITAMTWDEDSGALRPIQDLSTLPEGYSGNNDAAHIALTPDGRFAYVSNRGHNSIAVFKVHSTRGWLTAVGHYSTLGDWPRNFCIDPDGRFLLAANQKSGNIVEFSIDQKTGALAPTGIQVSEPTPYFVMIVDL